MRLWCNCRYLKVINSKSIGSNIALPLFPMEQTWERALATHTLWKGAKIKNISKWQGIDKSFFVKHQSGASLMCSLVWSMHHRVENWICSMWELNKQDHFGKWSSLSGSKPSHYTIPTWQVRTKTIGNDHHIFPYNNVCEKSSGLLRTMFVYMHVRKHF